MFKIPKLLKNMDDNISRGASKAERAVRQAYEDDIVNGATANKVRVCVNRERDKLRGKKAELAELADRAEEAVMRWK